MFATPPHFQVPAPAQYAQYGYTTTPLRHKAAPQYNYYAVPSSKGHSRHSSHDPRLFSHGSPLEPPSYRFTPQSYDHQYAGPPPPFAYATPTKPPKPSKREHVSGATRIKEKVRGFADRDGFKQQPHFYDSPPAPKGKTGSKSNRVRVEINDFADIEFSSPKGSPPPPYHASHEEFWAAADARYHDQAKDEPPLYRSNTTRQRAYSGPTPPPRAKTAPMPSTTPRKATAADAASRGIPAGYSIKNWDPTEEPILLLGSVFDANSLGKWIYDWTVFHHGPATPMSDMAGDLWLLLIQLAGKLSRSEEALPRIRHPEDHDLVDEFIESGERLQQRFSKILKTCEDYMWQVAKNEAAKKSRKSSSTPKKPAMGAKSGCEFVECMFGRDRKLQETEKLMTGMRLWSMRFDANCEDILRYPAA